MFILRLTKDDPKTGGKPVCYPVRGQRMQDGTTVKTNVKATCTLSKMNFYPNGTYFYTEDLVPMASCYAADEIYPIGYNGPLLEQDKSEKDSFNYAAASQLLDDLRKGGFLDDNDETDTRAEEKPRPAAKKDSLLARINKEYPCPDLSEGFYVEPACWQVLVRNVLKKENTLLVGPSGTGKTELVMYLAKKLGMDLSIYDMGAMHDPLTQLLGSHRLEAAGGSTRSVFEYAQFVSDIQKPGIILLDELTRAPQMTDNILFPCLDSRRYLPVEQAGEKETRRVSVHPDCIFIATANIGAEYTGTTQLDKAIRSRFLFQEVSYMKQDDEVQVLCKRKDIDKEDAFKLVRVANDIRKQYRDGVLSEDISTRETLRAAEFVADGWDVGTAINMVYVPIFEADERDKVKRLITKY